MKYVYLFFAAFIAIGTVNAQGQQQQTHNSFNNAATKLGTSGSPHLPADRPQIDRLCGCFEVSFKYAETFAPESDYKYHEREEIGGTAELALPVEVSDNKIVIQHLLIVSPSVVVKHWREEWTYENPVIWRYKGEKVWERDSLPANEIKGKWTQSVWEVSDEPRYQGVSQFVPIDNRIIWQSTADAPLPRREYSTRSDYNILKRTNRLNLTDSGYVHEQDNQKIIRGPQGDRLLVEEKGLNIYRRIDDRECAAAKEYWQKNGLFWQKVRDAWDRYLAGKRLIQLRTNVEEKMLHVYLMDLAKKFSSGEIPQAAIDGTINNTIQRFIVRLTNSGD